MAWFGEKILDFMVWMGKKILGLRTCYSRSVGGEKRGTVMATVLGRKLTAGDTSREILVAVKTLAQDKNHRLLQSDEDEWMQMKLKEIVRLTSILIKREQ